ESIRVDPIRLVEAVTAGVAFLAAGLIIFSKGEVHGLTTGAGMWLAAAVGLACGLGFWQIAVLATALALIILGVLREAGALASPSEDSGKGSRAAGKTAYKGEER
ncbi:MAG TPA: MgtC/SapB family protein, partial [Mesorhizobium sp.]|nr:MgtC/SapB family protein [Mesorhizobium sp.]